MRCDAISNTMSIRFNSGQRIQPELSYEIADVGTGVSLTMITIFLLICLLPVDASSPPVTN